MEEYVEIPSDSGITFNVQPKMKALEIAEKARDAILSRKFHQVCNMACCKWFFVRDVVLRAADLYLYRQLCDFIFYQLLGFMKKKKRNQQKPLEYRLFPVSR